eukprot:GHUV01017689.1.p1 GENE.GHUV01017689.1~~GHUV01017689.1.p1  ORF type:complete len:506 (+),score=131.19 GHUV01017689.1:870-2387(+)
MIACILCFIFMAIEVAGGYIAKSVAIMSDAAHMLSDVSAFLVSIFATWAATQPSSWHYSFGYHRAEILGALVSVLTIWAVTGALVFEAFQRTMNPVRVDGKLMFIIASAGVVFNILIALTLGVHGHLGHAHGPEGCSGHDHGHGHGDEHDHGHAGHKHEHSHSKCNSSHPGSHSKGQHQHVHSSGSGHQQPGSGLCGGHQAAEHDHSHSHEHETHHHRSDSSCSSHSSSESHYHSHSEDEDHQHLHSDDAGTSAAVAVPVTPKDSVVINLPMSPTKPGGCGQQGHALSCCCTIRRTGSREIEVRYELPASDPTVVASPVVGASSRARRLSHSHAGHDHDGDSHGSINLRSAVLHVIGDLLQSVGVAIAGGLIWLHQDDPRWYLADPICTFVFSVAVLLTTKSVLRDIVHVLMERTPQHMNIPAMSQVMMGMEGIRDVHDLHIWNISASMKPVLTAHVHIGPDADPTAVLQKLEEYVRDIGIDHSTIQICNPQGSLDGQLAAAEDV